jgi:DinB superfamily
MQETPQQYTQRMLGYIEGQDPLRVQRSTPGKLAKMVQRLDKKRMLYNPTPGKWSIAEILAHLADTEVVGGWRMRLILSQSGTPIQAFDQDNWAKTFNYRRRDPKASLETFRVLRENNLGLLKSVPKSLWENYGMHQERGKETIGHMVRMYAGHDLNHLRQVESLVEQSRKPSRARTK